MGLFGRKIAMKEETAAQQPDLAAMAGLDALADTISTFGTYAFEIEEEDHEQFLVACERWACHLRLGIPFEQTAADAEPTAPATSGERDLAQVRQFIRERRVRERSYVNRRLRDYTALVWDLVDNLRQVDRRQNATSRDIRQSLAAFERVVATGSLEQIRRHTGQLANQLVLTLDRQRQEQAREMEKLAGRLAEAERQREHAERATRCMSRQLTAMRKDLMAARQQLEIDPLTKVYNRRAFDAALRRYMDLSMLGGQTLALLMVDLDHFKQINDEHGHLAGDRVLIATADAINRCFMRKEDFISRYGGEEFAILLMVAEADDVPRLAEQLLVRLRRLEPAGAEEVGVTASIGHTCLQPDDSAEDFIGRADAALYLAKSQGRDCHRGDDAPAAAAPS
ncbi:MAG: diguanylate cyclase [Pseudomonadota bacterium]|nr:diguanylate cyclase [Pseudomonadota bacterium]HJO36620.1 diguanylate cyclase [Gammaproteobacteria bacterium]